MTTIRYSGVHTSHGVPGVGVVCAVWLILVAADHSYGTPPAAPPASPRPTARADDHPDTPYERTLRGLSETVSRLIEQAVSNACRTQHVPGATCGAVREAMVDQWHQLMDPKDQTVHDLIAKYLAMRTSATPPTADEVKAWAELAHTLLDKQVVRLRREQEQLRGVVKPEPRATLALRIAIMNALTEIGREHIERWQRGDFEAQEFWQDPAHPPTPNGVPVVRSSVRSSARPPNPRVQPAPPLDLIGVELTRWAKYVKDFIQRFDLDEGQRDAAQSCLSELTARAKAHRQRYREALLVLEQRIHSKKTSPQIETEIKLELVRLYGPIDDMFAELRDRLKQIPTERQRRKAEPSHAIRHAPTP